MAVPPLTPTSVHPRVGRVKPDLANRLRDALTRADFTYAGVAGALGPGGVRRPRPQRDGARAAAYRRWVAARDPDPAVPAPGPGHPGRGRAGAARPVDRLAAEGILERTVGEVAARLDVRPHATGDRDLWVVSDLTPGLDGSPNRVGADHVLGISPASTSLARLTIREPVGRSLDLGTGCGVQALHLAGAQRLGRRDRRQRPGAADHRAQPGPERRPAASTCATARSSSPSPGRRST